MARLSIEERIAQLEAQRKALKARLSKEERARDTRRKVLLGAFLLERMEDAKATGRDPDFTRSLNDWLTRELPAFLSRPNDRALFPEWIAQDAAGPATGHNGSGIPLPSTGSAGEGAKRENNGAGGAASGEPANALAGDSPRS